MYILTINLRAFLIFLLHLLFLQEVLFCVIIGINERAKLLWTPNKLLAPRSPEFTAARCRWPDLGIVYNSEKQNAKDHNTVSRYSITHLIDLNCRKLKLHVTTSVSFFACPLKKIWVVISEIVILVFGVSLFGK